MKLTLNKFHVQDIQFAEASSFCSGAGVYFEEGT